MTPLPPPPLINPTAQMRSTRDGRRVLAVLAVKGGCTARLQVVSFRTCVRKTGQFSGTTCFGGLSLLSYPTRWIYKSTLVSGIVLSFINSNITVSKQRQYVPFNDRSLMQKSHVFAFTVFIHNCRTHDFYEYRCA